MAKLIKTWDELYGLESENYKIIPDEFGYAGWIVPKDKSIVTEENYFDHHEYLSTHTFYGEQYKASTEILQKFGFDVELDNWDKGEMING